MGNYFFSLACMLIVCICVFTAYLLRYIGFASGSTQFFSLHHFIIIWTMLMSVQAGLLFGIKCRVHLKCDENVYFSPLCRFSFIFSMINEMVTNQHK